MKPEPIKETDLAAKVVQWLQCHHWDVYQEVGHCGRVADIVCKQGPVLWVIECKTSLGLNVIDQAYDWRSFAHRVSVAVPAPPQGKRPPRSRGIARYILRTFEIGLLIVSGASYTSFEDSQVMEELHAPLHRRIIGGLADDLRAEQKTWAKAGSADGNHWTPFKATCREVQRYVADHDGCTLKEMVDSVNHHYASTASAKGSLSTWIQQGAIKGVSAARDGKQLRLRWTTPA